MIQLTTCMPVWATMLVISNKKLIWLIGETMYYILWTLQWRHNEHDCVLNHQPHDCLLHRLLRCRSKMISKLAFVREIHLWPVNSPHKAPVTQKMFSFDDLMTSSWNQELPPAATDSTICCRMMKTDGKSLTAKATMFQCTFYDKISTK